MVRRHGVTVSFALIGFGEPDVAKEFQLRYFFVHIKSPNMKNTKVLLLAATVLAVASCSKGGGSAPSGYSCICHLSYLGKDTIIKFTYSGITRDSAISSCNYETTWAHSITGASGSNCDFVQ